MPKAFSTTARVLQWALLYLRTHKCNKWLVIMYIKHGGVGEGGTEYVRDTSCQRVNIIALNIFCDILFREKQWNQFMSEFAFNL